MPFILEYKQVHRSLEKVQHEYELHLLLAYNWDHLPLIFFPFSFSVWQEYLTFFFLAVFFFFFFLKDLRKFLGVYSLMVLQNLIRLVWTFKVQSTLEQHEFELHGSFIHIFLSINTTVGHHPQLVESMDVELSLGATEK